MLALEWEEGMRKGIGRGRTGRGVPCPHETLREERTSWVCVMMI
jgi:hypothetical protein